MRTIHTSTKNQRISTQELLTSIREAVEQGECDFVIEAQGQHDIPGPLWNSQGKALHITVRNPGQRVGAMMLPGTNVLVEGSAPADVGWLNAGGTLIVKGDVGDTAGHCAASGTIYIGGRAGARSGSLMKHDPLYKAPELWILKHTGSFSFEFFSGGYAVVCGCDCEQGSVLGDRPCVGMVGGVVYVRGSVGDIPQDLALLPLDHNDQAFLNEGLDRFLRAVDEKHRAPLLKDWEVWHKIVPAPKQELVRPSVAQYRKASWIPGGLFADIVADSGIHAPILGTGLHRLRIPVWENESNTCLDCHKCALTCPRNAIERTQDTTLTYTADPATCIGCGLCQAVCPNHIWRLTDAPPLVEHLPGEKGRCVMDNR